MVVVGVSQGSVVHGSVLDVVFVVLGVDSVDLVVAGELSWWVVAGVVLGLLVVFGTETNNRVNFNFFIEQNIHLSVMQMN